MERGSSRAPSKCTSRPQPCNVAMIVGGPAMTEFFRILVVDDDSTISQLISEMLCLDGFEDVQWASNGVEAVNQYRRLMPDLVLMDISMPVMDGYEASCRIKALDPAAKIVVLTGNPGDPRARRILAEGIAKAVIPKPVRLQHLRDIIRSQATGTPDPDAPPCAFSMFPRNSILSAL